MRRWGPATATTRPGAGIGLATERRGRRGRARRPGPDRPARAADDVGAAATSAFDADDAGRLERFLDELPGPVDHVLVTAGRSYYGRLADMDLAEVHRHVGDRLLASLRVGRRRDQLRATLPIRRVVGPADVAALAVHLMTNSAVTGATYDVDGGQQLIG